MRASFVRLIAALIASTASVLAQHSEPTNANATAIEEPYQSLRTELLQIGEDDQKYRLQLEEIRQAGRSINSEQAREPWAKIKASDATNRRKVKTILDQYGWLGPEQVGADASEAMFMVIQHSDLATQQKYLPMLRAAVKENRLSPKMLPLLEDRVALRSGRRQVYGTQIGDSAELGGTYVSPLEDPDNVDKRRAEVGLGPLAEYVKRWSITWDVEAYKKRLPEIEAHQKRVHYPSPAAEITAQNKPLQVELEAVAEADQKYRSQSEECEKTYGRESMEMQELWVKIHALDETNQLKVTTIIDRQGWLGPDEVGEKASGALFLVIQHASLSVQQKYLPVLRAAVHEDKAHPTDLALLEDRVAVGEGRRQAYGSQIGFDELTRKYYVQPLEDADHVDKRRAEVGLGPIADYVKKWGISWDPEICKKQPPEPKPKQLD